MKIFGRYMSGSGFFSIEHPIADGSYVALDIHAAHVRPVNDEPIKDCDQCYVEVYSGQFSFSIYHYDNKYYTPIIAKTLIRALATKDLVELDDHNMYLYEALDYSLRPTTIVNDEDDGFNSLPLLVEVSKDT